jgi:leucyl aminopeptidase
MQNTNLHELNQEWKNVDFKVNGAAPASVAYDLVVTDYGSRMTIIDSLKSRPTAKSVASEELKKIKKDENDLDAKTLSVSYEGKGGLRAVILMGNQQSSYSLQETLRKVFASVLKTDDQNREVNISIKGLKDDHAEEVLQWIASMAVLGRFRAEVFGKKLKDQKKLGKLTVYIQTSLNKKRAEDLVTEGRVMGFCNNQVRYFADLPGNVLNPKSYREKAAAMAKELKVDFEFIDKKQLTKKGAGAFLAVMKADLNEQGGIAHFHYKGKGSAKKRKIAIVGKGICFDTGGYNIKTGDYMLNMHRDMTGSAVALALFRALVELDSQYEVHAYLAIAENLVSHEGFRPNDIVYASNGMSIEVVDTDAEGRMVLSDTLAIASEEEPEFIIDFATLTGSVVRAIDTRRCGAYSNQLKVSQLAVEVGERCGERVWNFPIGEDYNESLKSPIADVRQCASANSADHIYASTFLSKFVGKNIPWLHIDLAADTNKGGLGLVSTETTGFGVRFGYEMIRQFIDGKR